MSLRLSRGIGVSFDERTFPGNYNRLGMERARSARDRAARYQQQGAKLRRMAEAEPVKEIRTLLLRTANQYEDLAANLLQAPKQRPLN